MCPRRFGSVQRLCHVSQQREWIVHAAIRLCSSVNADSAFPLEVDRALDNLNKSGKLFSGPSRRDSMPMMGGPRPFSEYGKPPMLIRYLHSHIIEGAGMGGMTQHRHSIGDYDQVRSPSGSNLQNFYANQRHQPRPNEADQMMQAKRRMAAQRERELRNYHQEQQYNRSKLQHTHSRSGARFNKMVQAHPPKTNPTVR